MIVGNDGGGILLVMNTSPSLGLPWWKRWKVEEERNGYISEKNNREALDVYIRRVLGSDIRLP
jgi:hypothetical protein